jgi:hypothetical protein
VCVCVPYFSRPNNYDNFTDFCSSHIDSSIPHALLHNLEMWIIFNLQIIEGKRFEFSEIIGREEYVHVHPTRS